MRYVCLRPGTADSGLASEAEAARSNRAGRMAQPCCVASLVPAPSGVGLRVRRGGGMTRNQAGGR